MSLGSHFKDLKDQVQVFADSMDDFKRMGVVLDEVLGVLKDIREILGDNQEV